MEEMVNRFLSIFVRLMIGTVILVFLSCRTIVPITDEVELRIDDITVTAEGTWYAVHRPIIPPEGPTFFIHLEIVIENASDENISDFMATKITLYYENTDDEFVTFSLQLQDGTAGGTEIPSGVIDTLVYINKDAYHSDIAEGTMLYGCVNVEWQGAEVSLATPASSVEYLW
jgi:hypothetical protein